MVVSIFQPNEDYRVGVCGPDQAGPHYDPQMAIAGSPGYGERCSFETPEGCEIGDLTGKLGTIDVAATPGDYSNDAFFFTDSYLNLTGFQEIIGRSIVVHIPDRGPDRLGCAPLVEAETITLTTKSSPLATISQYSPYQNTIITLGDLPCKSKSFPLNKESYLYGVLCVCVCGQHINYD